MSSPTTSPTSARPRAESAAGHPALAALAIAAVAFVLRFGIVLVSRGGPGGLYGYDAGVYYSGADALTFGRVPYQDFVFLHPPGILLALAPFAALGRLTTDHAGYVAANVFFNLLSAANAVLVWRIASRWGLGRRAALIGGLFYAVWWGAVNAEVGVRLEPLGTFLFLAALLLLTGDGRARRIAAGVLLGAVCCVKIWWAVPVLIVLAWHLVPREQRRDGVRLAVGAVVGAVAVAGPFFALAGGTMFHRVVTDQLGRSPSNSPYTRLQFLSGLHQAAPALAAPLMAAGVVVVGGLFVAAIAVGWQQRPARLVVVVVAAQFVVLMVSPSFFTFYAGFLSGPLALTVAAATEPGRRVIRLDHRTGWAAAALAAVVTAGAVVHSHGIVTPFPGRTFEKATAGARCVMTDSNSALILMNRLSDDLAHGCPNWVDVTGHTYYGADKSGGGTRTKNLHWQADLRSYLLGGDFVVIARAKNGTGLSRRTAALIDAQPVIARRNHFVLRRVRP